MTRRRAESNRCKASDTLFDSKKAERPRPRTGYDEIWEHKRGKIWRLVERLTQENRALRYQNRVLQARLRRVS